MSIAMMNDGDGDEGWECLLVMVRNPSAPFRSGPAA